MPELPEVETIVRTLQPQVLHKHLAAVTVLLEKSLAAGASLLPLLSHSRIVRVFRRAKLLLVELETKHADNKTLLLAFHLKMTGRFFVHPAGTPPLKHTRIVFDLAEKNGSTPAGRLFFDDARTFGYCRIMRPEELNQWPFWAALGPEPLGCTPEELAETLQSRFATRKAAVKGMLLDQTVLAGIGNIYADEALFSAGIAPNTPANSVPVAAIVRLAHALQDVLTLSIQECGSSLRDYRDAFGNAGAFQNNFMVYGRKGEDCKTCKSPLTTTRVAGRSTVYCPVCQI